MALEDRLHPLLSSYVASPQWVKSTIGRAYAWVPNSVKYGRRFPHFQSEVPGVATRAMGSTRRLTPS